MREGPCIGVDLGGTKVEAVVAQAGSDGIDVIARKRVPTPSDEGYEAIVAATAGLIRSVAQDAGLDLAKTSVGVGMPGGTTRREGLVKNANTVCLNGRPFRTDLVQNLGISIAFDNDANLFALAETKLGAARDGQQGIVFGVIMGTGVGGGLVVNGSIWEGAQGIAGEWGHHAVFHEQGPVCYCGNRGCLELYAAGPAVERDYAARAGKALSLSEIAAQRGSDLHAEAAIQGLLLAFGRGLANVIAILDPTVIVLGGGVSNLDCLYDEGRALVARHVFNDELTTPIQRHALGDSAGVLGAALMALSMPQSGG